MTREELCKTKEEMFKEFVTDERAVEIKKHGSGHIHDTFLVTAEGETKDHLYILQRINTSIFSDPVKLMENISSVTSFLKKEVIKNGGDEKREVMNVIDTPDGKAVVRDKNGSYWRVYDYITDSLALDAASTAAEFGEAGYAFGRFGSLLKDFDVSRLHDTIPNFHNTPLRFETFKIAVEEDKVGRAKEVKKEIEFFMDHEKDMGICEELKNKGDLPIRVTHNDTKLNNVLFDKKTRKGLCVVDLDTVMPGLSVFDFGDGIRFGANTASEDELDLSKVMLSTEYFKAYAERFLAGWGGRLSDTEVEMLSQGAKTMTMECGMRFLTDYLQGDVYFGISREKHNLDRCRTQIKLAQEMEKKKNETDKIIKDLTK